MKRILGLCLVASLALPVFATMPAGADPAFNSIIGTRQRDVLVGTRGRDLIIGLAGNDRIWGGGQSDKLYGNTGRDRIVANDGHRDLVFGGRPGRNAVLGDVCVVDTKDVTFGCERVRVRPAR